MIYTDNVHLIADTQKELHSFARKVGLNRAWYQGDRKIPHYDLTTARMRNRVVRMGARLINSKKLVNINK